MDLWVVAAAAGAGYLGKYLQNSSLSEKERLLQSSSFSISTQRSSESWNFLQQIRDKTCPLKRLAREKAYKEVFSEQFGGYPDSVFEIASTSDQVRLVEEAQWLKSSTKLSAKERYLHKMESVCGVCNKNLHKNRPSRGTVLEKVDEYASISVEPPPSPTMRPSWIADGDQVEDSFDHISFGLWPSLGEEDPFRMSSTHNPSDVREDTSSSRKNASHAERCTCCNPSSKNNRDYVELQEHVTASQKRMFRSQPGQLNNEMLPFLIGLTIGILPTTAATKREVQKMNEKLDEAMTLVQDLKEELDMKDNLTVKELVYDGCSQSRSTKTPSLLNQELSLSNSEQESKHSRTSFARKMAGYDKSEDSQLMSRIEAELEAELEWLQLNMDLERRTSHFVELDTQSELDKRKQGRRADAFRRQYYDSETESESDEGSDGIMIQRVATPPPNYAVSPRELSIRLHEVIESRLEARIKELETALQMNQNRLHSLESQCNNGESSETPGGSDQLSDNAVDEVEDVSPEMSAKDQETIQAVFKNMYC